jgi:hypothetical protein
MKAGEVDCLGLFHTLSSFGSQGSDLVSKDDPMFGLVLLPRLLLEWLPSCIQMELT